MQTLINATLLAFPLLAAIGVGVAVSKTSYPRQVLEPGLRSCLSPSVPMTPTRFPTLVPERHNINVANIEEA